MIIMLGSFVGLGLNLYDELFTKISKLESKMRLLIFLGVIKKACIQKTEN